MASGASIGMMDPAFFVGRRAIVDWLNSTFRMNISKIEETASGAVACQLLDAIYPGEVSMQRVRWDAKSPHEFIDNYKVLQAVFEKKGVDKYLDVEKLMRGKYQDNLENMQWFKSFFERNYSGQAYDPILRRAKGKGANAMPAFALEASKRGSAAGGGGSLLGEEGEQHGSGMPAPAAASASARMGGSRARSSVGTSNLANSLSAGSGGGKMVGSMMGSPGAAGSGSGSSSSSSSGSGALAAMGAQLNASQAQVANLTANVADLRLSVESLEKERDFYFGKLRDVEILLQSYSGPDRPTVDALFKILYLADDEFVAVGGEGGSSGSGEEGAASAEGGGQ